MNTYRVALLVRTPPVRGHIVLDRHQVVSIYCFGESETEAENIALENMEEAEVVEVESI